MQPELNPFFEKPTAPRPKVGSILFSIISICSLLLLVSWFTILGQNQVDGPSMQPNFVTGQFLLVSRIPQMLNWNYQRGEVIIYQKPGFPEFVKRIIALPGETVAIRNCFFLCK